MSSNPFILYSKQGYSNEKNKKRGDTIVIDGAPLEQEPENVKLGSPASHFPIQLIIFAWCVAVGIILIRTFYLQIVQGDEFRSQADVNRIQTYVTEALRGVIYDNEGNLLVKNVPNFQLVLDADEANYHSDEERAQYITELQKAVPLSFNELLVHVQHSEKTHQPIVIQEQISYQEALQQMISVQNYPGLSIQTQYNREYLTDESYTHIIGYTGLITAEEYEKYKGKEYLFNDEIGKSGIEKSYEDVLRGKDGNQQVEVDYQGIEKSIISDSKPESGNNLYLTIDSTLQRSLYEKLAQVVEENELPGAAAVALDPRDGSVRALVSYPSYDNNQFVGGVSTEVYQSLIEDEREPLFHRAISGEYPSGSTFKPIVAAAALEEGIITPNTTVESTGGIQIEERFFFPDWKSGGHGTTNITKALAESVNTFFYLIGGGDNTSSTGLGVERIALYATKFGLNSPVGIDLPGEGDGFLPSKAWKEEFKDEPWYIGDTYHLAIGQGDILVTPLQIANYTAIFANGGTFYQPTLVDHISNQNGDIIQSHEPVIKTAQVVSENAINIVRQGLREAVIGSSGSARSLQTLPVSSAAKTGTAQFGVEEKTHSWFTAFAPYEDPELVITVLVEEGGGGNDTALPIARAVLQEYFSR